MHVVAILHCYPPEHNAGAEWAVHTMFRSLIQAGHDVTVVLTAQTGPQYDLDGVLVHPSQHKSDPTMFAQQADVLVSHLENTPRTTALARMFHKPVVHVLHNTFEPSKRWLTPDVNLAVFNSQWMKQDYETYFSQVGHSGVPSIVVNPPVIAADYKTTPGDRVTLINLTDGKGAKVFWELADRMPDVKFLAVVGGYGEQIVPDNPPPNVVVQSHTAGHRMRQVYAQTRVLLMPSEYESWGRVGVEAMSSGIPVVAHPTVGLRESLGDAGFFVDRDDLDGWESQIRFLLDGRRIKTAAKAARSRSAQLDPAADLARFVETVEDINARHRLRHRT